MAKRWSPRTLADIRHSYPDPIYDRPDEDGRALLSDEDLVILPLVDEDGLEVPIYTLDGYQIPRRLGRYRNGTDPCGVLINLSHISNLFNKVILDGQTF